MIKSKVEDVMTERGCHPGRPQLVMTQYRRHILSAKKRYGSARSLIHYRRFIESYLWAKRQVLAK